ncbi:F-box/WD repeat-containing protein 7 (Archipelago homolog) (hAgo) (F-box and WD-40 domain-containing protein 7) (F-box protein FBX30) (SEL-10) (hCdc4), partial [Durusdinium trenchii]
MQRMRRPARAVAVSNAVIVAADATGRVWVWNRESLELLHVIEVIRNELLGVALDGQVFGVCGSQGVLRLFDAASGEQLQQMDGHRGTVHGITMRGDTVVSGGVDKTLKVWSKLDGQCLHTIDTSSTVRDVAMDDEVITGVMMNKTAKVWSRSSFACLHTFQCARTPFAVTLDASSVAVAMDSGIVQLWNRPSYELGQAFAGLDRHASCIDMDSEHVVAGSWDTSVKVWDRTSGMCLQDWVVDIGFVQDVAVLGDLVVSTSNHSTVRLHSISSGELLEVLNGSEVLGDPTSVDFGTFT